MKKKVPEISAYLWKKTSESTEMELSWPDHKFQTQSLDFWEWAEYNFKRWLSKIRGRKKQRDRDQDI